MALGEAIVELLKQELSKRKVVFRVVERRWDDLQFGRLLSAEEGAGLMVEVEVEEKDRQVGEECLEAVYSDGRKLKEKALHVARTKYIKDDHELEEYRRGLEETYGW